MTHLDHVTNVTTLQWDSRVLCAHIGFTFRKFPDIPLDILKFIIINFVIHIMESMAHSPQIRSFQKSKVWWAPRGASKMRETSESDRTTYTVKVLQVTFQVEKLL